MSIGYENAKRADERIDQLRRKVDGLRQNLGSCRQLASERGEALEEAERKAGKLKQECESLARQNRALSGLVQSQEDGLSRASAQLDYEKQMREVAEEHAEMWRKHAKRMEGQVRR